MDDRLVLDITGKTKKAFNQEVVDVFEKGVQDVFQSDKWTNWLSFCASFRQYSVRNRLLIHLQMPYSTHVASMKDWNEKYNRSVIKGQGSQGLKIFAPTTFTNKKDVTKHDEKGNVVMGDDGKPQIETKVQKTEGFILVSVYDVSQTHGEPIPTLTEELKGNYSNRNKVIKSLEEIAGCSITFENIEGSAKGYYRESLLQRKIVIRNGMSDEQTIKTAVHETAHAVLHRRSVANIKDLSSSDKELQAESVAFIVCKHLGIDTADYSFPYLASWSRDKELLQLKNTMDVIVKTADDFIKKLDVLMMKLDLSSCMNKEAIQVFLANSNYINDRASEYHKLPLEEKFQYLNEKISFIEKYSADCTIVEIQDSKSKEFKQGELYTLEDIDYKLNDIYNHKNKDVITVSFFNNKMQGQEKFTLGHAQFLSDYLKMGNYNISVDPLKSISR